MDPPTTKRKIIQFFHQTTAKTNNEAVEPACRADPGGSDVEFLDRELLFPAGDECSAEEAVTLVTSLTVSSVSQPSSSSSASGAISDVGDLLKTVATSNELELVVDALTSELRTSACRRAVTQCNCLTIYSSQKSYLY